MFTYMHVSNEGSFSVNTQQHVQFYLLAYYMETKPLSLYIEIEVSTPSLSTQSCKTYEILTFFSVLIFQLSSLNEAEREEGKNGQSGGCFSFQKGSVL